MKFSVAVVLTLAASVSSLQAEYDCDGNNPCTDENIAAGAFKHASTDPHSYVQCSAYGDCWVMACSGSLVWSQEVRTCIYQEHTECSDGPKKKLTVCENYGYATLNCVEGTTIHVTKANYGRTQSDSKISPYGRDHKDETDCIDQGIEDAVIEKCQGEESCTVPCLFFGDPCVGNYKYLHIKYRCVCDDGIEDGGPYNCNDNNPCTPENIEAERFNHAHRHPKKYVHCDDFGVCFVMRCAKGTVFSSDFGTCIHD